MEKIIFRCECGRSLDIQYDYKKIKKLIIEKDFKARSVSHWKYWMFYPIENLKNIISLQEGGTPLIESKEIGSKIGCELLFKNEGVNPTGSFKDRGSTIEISKAKQVGAKRISCATTGNMGASVAAYAARAGIKTRIFIPEKTSEQKIAQIKAYGAELVPVKGTYEDALKAAESLKDGYYMAGDYPFRGEGEKSVGYEIIDQMGWKAPDFIVAPMGNGTMIYAVWKAIKELKICGLIKKLPKLVGVQAEGCDPIVRAFKKNLDDVPPVKNPRTIADAIACENPIDGLEALTAIRESKGLAESVSDREILNTMSVLGREGIYAEPGGAAATAGLLKLKDIFEGKTIISLVTGHGLKFLR